MKKVLFVLMILYCCSINAQWKSAGGPNEANIDPIYANGTILFAGTQGNGGIYKSTDNGDNWTEANTGIQYPRNIFGFCTVGQKIVVAVNTDIFISSDNGANWQKITPQNNTYEVRGFAYDGTYLYAILHGSGIARSENEGTTWTVYSTGITDKAILDLINKDGKLFIGSTSGIFISSDKGVNWQATNSGIAANSSTFRSFAKIGNDIYVCSYYGGVHKSTDNGLTWSTVNQGLQTTNTRRIYASGTNLFVSTDGGIHRSTNGGTSWTKINNGTMSDYSNNFTAIGTTIFVAASSRGVYKSNNNGDTWTQCSKGLNNSIIKALLKMGNTLYAGAYISGGVHNTNNGGTTWNNSYPSVSNVVQLVNNNTNIYAATDGWGLMKSVDNGVNWTALTSSNMNLLKIFSVAFGNNKIFAGTYNGGVYTSADNGVTWTETNNNLANKNINMLTFVGTKLYAATTTGIFATTDYGSSWSASGLTGKNIITIKANNNKIYAGTWGDGVYISGDNGITWTQIKNGMTYLEIYAIAFDGSNNIYVAAGTNVYSSKDEGANWVLKNEGVPHHVYSLEVVDNYLYAGTVTYGVWKRPLSEFFVAPSAPVLTTNNVFTQTSAKITWNGVVGAEKYFVDVSSSNTFGSFVTGYENKDVGNVASTFVYGLQPNTQYFVRVRSYNTNGTSQNSTVLTVTTRANEKWIQTTGPSKTVGGLANTAVRYFITVDNTLYAAAYGATGLFKTTDNGNNWIKVFDCTNDVVNLFNDGNNIYASTNGSGVYISEDKGLTWQQRNSGLGNLKVYSLWKSGNNLYGATFGDGIFVTTNNGNSWTAINNGLSNKFINTIYASGANLFAGSNSAGIFISNNGGTSWTQSTLTGKNIIVIKGASNKLYAVTWGSGVYISTDNGANWTQSNSGMGSNLNCLIFTRHTDNDLFITTENAIYYSKNGGSSWANITDNFPAVAIWSIEVQGNYIFAGTSELGVFKRTLTEVITSVDENKEIHVEFNLFQNYPNPFNPTTSIKYSVPKNSLVKIQVFDILGRELAQLVNQEKQPGIYETKFNASNLTSGVYFYRIQADNFSEIKKMILIK